MRNVSDEGCRLNKNTRFVFSNFLSEILEIVENCGRSGQATAHAICLLDD